MFKNKHMQAEELETILFNTNGLFILHDIKIEGQNHREKMNIQTAEHKHKKCTYKTGGSD